ncbi:MAG: PTS sugar transporter subunit IIA [Gammaproteobacteria bacterium]
MKVKDILSQVCIELDTSLNSKKAVLDHLSETLEADGSEPSSIEIFEGLLSRERLGSTGLGNGIAIPHARIPGISKTTATFLRITNGIDFDAIDNLPVDMFFVLLVPEDSTDEHLEILAQLVEMFRNDTFLDKLRTQKDPNIIWTMLTEGKT